MRGALNTTTDTRPPTALSKRWEERAKASHRELERPDDADPTFAALRPKLLAIAYRVLGSSAKAEDVVQETWLRWRGSDRSAVRNPAAFLATTTTRLALNVAQSARLRRETYVGQWLTEPVDTRDGPARGAERRGALERAVLLLEKLRPRERAVYMLREAFDCSYAQIAGMLQLTEAHARQLASRARKPRRRAATNGQRGGTPNEMPTIATPSGTQIFQHGCPLSTDDLARSLLMSCQTQEGQRCR